MRLDGLSRQRLLSGVCVFALIAGGSVAGALAVGTEEIFRRTKVEEQRYRQEALAHAHALAMAYRRLETHIRNESTAATAWTGDVPPATTGWFAGWTERGVRARYCEDTLIVYMGPDRLKGVGADHGAVHAAAHAYVTGADRGRLPVLHWLEAGVAEGAVGRPAVTLPGCLSGAGFGGPLPSGRAALAGSVPDPFVNLWTDIDHERRVDACAVGEHGPGRTMVREVSQERNARGDPVGAPVQGAWTVLIDQCRADYTEREHFAQDCTWMAGPPHNRQMTGREVWRRLKSVTADGVTYGAPEFVSTSCWGGTTPTAPEAVTTTAEYTETLTEECTLPGSGDEGGFFAPVDTYERTRQESTIQWPWDSEPTAREPTYTNWVLVSSDCTTSGGGESSDVSGLDSGDGGGCDCGDTGSMGSDCNSADGSNNSDDGGTGDGGEGDGGGDSKPIVLDLDGDGVEYVSRDVSTAFFDINGDGYREHMGWVSGDDGFLAYDRDGDGRITERAEIAFVDYLPGARTDLEGLRFFDSDGDGALTPADRDWPRFGVWQDRNEDGVSDPGEFRSLDDVGVVWIGLGSDGRQRTVDGHRVFGSGTYRFDDGREHTFDDVELDTGDFGIRERPGGGVDVRYGGSRVPLPREGGGGTTR